MSWIKLHRRLLENDLASDPSSLALWIHLLLMASHNRFMSVRGSSAVQIMPGEILTSRKKLSQKTGLSESKIERILKAFLAGKLIEQHGRSKYRVISIVEWSRYQEDEQQIEQHSDTTKNTRSISKEPSNEGSITVGFQSNFEEWWIKYSKASHHPQGSKKNAAKNFSICIKKYSIEKINQATRNYLIECRRTNTKTKHAERFLKLDLIQQYQSEQETHESVLDRELRIHGRNTDALPSSAPRLESL